MHAMNIPQHVLDETRRRMRTVYAFETPDRLPFSYGVFEGRTDMTDKYAIAAFAANIYKNWKQQETEEDFKLELNHRVNNINKQYELFPYGDHDPGLDVNNFQEVLLLCLGTTYRILDDGTLEVDWAQNPMIHNVEKDGDKLVMGNYRNEGLVARLLAKMRYFAEHTDHKIPLRTFDMQAPLGMLMKLMDTDQFFMEFYDNPQTMKELLFKLADCIIDLLHAQEEAAGKGNLRGGLTVPEAPITLADDLVSVLTPELYIDYVAESNTRVFKAFGGSGTVHTCGPIWGKYLDAVLSVEGCINMNDIFIRADKSRTAADMLEIKKRMAGKMVYNTLLPLDIENFTVDFVKRLMDGGGVYLTDFGPKEVGLRLMDIIDRAAS